MQDTTGRTEKIISPVIKMIITMDLKRIPVFLIFIIVIQRNSYSRTAVNPFYSGKAVQHITARRQPLFRNSKFYNTIAKWQKSIGGKIANSILSLKGGHNKSTVIIILLVSFLYGIIHALGPGHRKTVLFSYFMARDAKPRDGIMAGFFLSILHAGSAIVLILFLYLIVKGSFLNGKVHAEIIMEKISYRSITAIGFLLIVYKVFLLLKKKGRSLNAADFSQTGSPQLILPIMLSGLVPCPGASSIMIFS